MFRTLSRATMAILVAATFSLTLMPATASADTISPHQAKQGTVKLGTAPGGYFTAVLTGQRPNNYCGFLAQNIRYRTSIYDAGVYKLTNFQTNSSGAANVKVGPVPNGAYDLELFCYQVSDLLTEHDVPAVIGNGPIVPTPQPVVPDAPVAPTPQAPAPEPARPAPPSFKSCTDAINNTFDEAGTDGAIADFLAGLIAKAPSEIFQTLCLIVIDPATGNSNPAEVFQNICRIGRGTIPADIAFAGIEEFGKLVKSKRIEQFGAGGKKDYQGKCE